MTVADLLLARAEDDRPGLRAEDGEWSWREVVAECAARAAWMRSLRPANPPRSSTPPRLSSSLDARDRLHLGVLCDNTPEMVFLLGGAALSGSVLVALNTSRSVAEIEGDAARADCDLVVVDEAYRDLATGLGEHVLVGDLSVPVPVPSALPVPLAPPAPQVPLAPLVPPVSLECAEVDPDTLLMLIFTSGTSGTPRAVRITHRKVTVPGESLAGRLLKPEDVVYCPMPLFHSGAIMAAYAPALAAGATLALRRRFSASGTLPDIRKYGCTYMQYVGKALSYVLATEPRADDRDNPLRISFGNEAAPAEQRAFAARFGCFVVDAYGSTETAISFSPDPTGPDGALGRLPEGVAILDPETGDACPCARFDAEGRLVNADEAIGELVNTRGSGLFAGYYNDADGDAERMRGGMFWSGDYAYADEAGYVFFAGRSLDRIRVDGENLGAVQVERVLSEMPGVREVAVYGVPDAAAGDQVMAAMVGAFEPERFVRFLGERRDLGPKWIPRYVRVCGELPTTPSNKILKRRLAAEGWWCGDPVWWRPGRELSYRLMNADDQARVRLDFERRGRLNLLEGIGR